MRRKLFYEVIELISDDVTSPFRCNKKEIQGVKVVTDKKEAEVLVGQLTRDSGDTREYTYRTILCCYHKRGVGK